MAPRLPEAGAVSYITTFVLMLQMLTAHIMAPHLPLEVRYTAGAQVQRGSILIAQPITCDGWDADRATRCYSIMITWWLP